MRHHSLPTRRPPLRAGMLAATALVAAETLVLFPLGEVAAPVSLGVVYLLGVLLVSIVWGGGLGILRAVSHDLRSPLTAIVTSAEALASPGHGPLRPFSTRPVSFG